MAAAHPTVGRVRKFAEALQSDAARLDGDVRLNRAAAQTFQAEGLNEFGGTRRPLPNQDSFESLASLAEFSGAFAFLALQQWVANLSYVDSGKGPWPRLTVAFGHLRNPKSPAPVWKDGFATGAVPWMTGAGIVEKALLGVRDEEGGERYAWVSARSLPRFRIRRRTGLIACDGASNAEAFLSEYPLPESKFFRVSPRGTLARGDRQATIWHTPLMAGCSRAALRLIEESPRVDGELVRSVRESYEKLEHEILLGVRDGVNASQGLALRSRASAAAVRLASLACLAHGGAALTPGHPAGRLYREAMVYRLMAQTDAIVADAFRGEAF